MRVAALDLGTNTFLCLIADVDKGQLQKVVADETELVRLGQGVDATGELHSEALVRAEKAFARYAQLIAEHKVEKVAAVATSAARDAKNRDQFFALTEKYKIPVEIISGDKEAELTFRGAVDMSEAHGTAVVDVGGGSTELVLGTIGADKKLNLKGHSYQIGSVRLVEKLSLLPPFEPIKIFEGLKFCKELFAKVKFDKKLVHQVRAVAGTPTTLAAMDLGIPFDAAKVENFQFSSPKLVSWVQKLSKMQPQEIADKYGIELKRADVLPAGIIVLTAAIEHLGQHECFVSTRGVRYGLAQHLSLS